MDQELKNQYPLTSAMTRETNLLFHVSCLQLIQPLCLTHHCYTYCNTYQVWTWSGFRIAIQPDSAIQNQSRIGLNFEKNSTGSDMDIGLKPDRIKYLDNTTGLGSDCISQWKYWTGLGLQKSPIRSTLIPMLYPITFSPIHHCLRVCVGQF